MTCHIFWVGHWNTRVVKMISFFSVWHFWSIMMVRSVCLFVLWSYFVLIYASAWIKNGKLEVCKVFIGCSEQIHKKLVLDFMTVNTIAGVYWDVRNSCIPFWSSEDNILKFVIIIGVYHINHRIILKLVEFACKYCK